MNNEDTKLFYENLDDENKSASSKKKTTGKKSGPSMGSNVAAAAGGGVVGGAVGAAVVGSTAHATTPTEEPYDDDLDLSSDGKGKSLFSWVTESAGTAEGDAAEDAAPAEEAEENIEEAIVAPNPDDVLLVNEDGIKMAHIDAHCFEDAFKMAREQVGPGGVFEFEGKLYTTYYPKEWEALTSAEQKEFQAAIHAPETEQVPRPEDVLLMNDEGIRFAHVDANSFSEAFAQARAQVGPGGVFEYNGKLYGTYLADEWGSMSRDEKLAFQNKVFGDLPGYTDHHYTAHTSTGAGTVHTTIHHEHVQHVHHHYDQPAAAPASTQHPAEAPAEAAQTAAAVASADDFLAVEPVDDEIRVLGVETVDTADGPMNVAAIAIGDDPALLVDIDNDGYIELGIHDSNYNGVIEDHEIEDISGAGIHIDELAAAAEYYEPNSFPATDDQQIDTFSDPDVMPV